MGRITIFTADGCPHCHRTMVAFRKRQIPFVMISITKYPEKRNDMISLSHGKASTPQVFFNTRHVGGADQAIALLEQWDAESSSSSSRSRNNNNQQTKKSTPSRYNSALHRYQEEIEKFADPANPRFCLPEQRRNNNDDEINIEAFLQRGEDDRYPILVPECSSKGDETSRLRKASVVETTEVLKDIMPLQDTSDRWTVNRMVFTGRQGTQALISHYHITHCDAVKYMKHLLEQNVIVSVSKNDNNNEATKPKNGSKLKESPSVPRNGNSDTSQSTSDLSQSTVSDEALYRLQCFAEPSILNSYRVWTTTSSKDILQHVKNPNEFLATLNRLMTHILMNVTDDDGTINYLAVRAHSLYPSFEEAVCALQKVDLTTMNDATKTAFGINLYNLMIKYAFIKVGAGTNDLSRYMFYNNVCFNVGGHIYSFQDWENGILRGNRKAPYALSLPFKANDPRMAYIVKNPDCRIHFALNCGARSCPPVNVYSVDNLSEELRLAAAAFCEDDTHVCFIVGDNHHKNNGGGAVSSSSAPTTSSSTTNIDLTTTSSPSRKSHRFEVRLNKIFAWYKVDFVQHVRDYPERLIEFLHGVKKQQLERLLESAKALKVPFKVSFLPYDWSTMSNAKHIANFEARDLKTQDRRNVLHSIFGSLPGSNRRRRGRHNNKPSTISSTTAGEHRGMMGDCTMSSYNEHDDDDENDGSDEENRMLEDSTTSSPLYSECSSTSHSHSGSGSSLPQQEKCPPIAEI